MVEQITFQTIFQFLQTLGILTAVFYYITTLRNAERAKHTDVLFQRIQSFDKTFSKAWGDVIFKDVSDETKWNKVYDPIDNLETFANMTYLQNRYNVLGLMLKEKYIDPDLLFRLYNPEAIINAWAHYQDHIKTRRKIKNHSNLFMDFEYLANEARRRFPEINLIKPFDYREA